MNDLFDIDNIIDANRVQLAPGDRIISYSDGVLDAGMNPDGTGALGPKGMEEIIHGTASLPLMAALTQMQLQLQIHQGKKPQFDDISLIISQRDDPSTQGAKSSVDSARAFDPNSLIP